MFASPLIKDNTRVLLLLLADHMKADRTVSVPQEKLADHIGRSKRRVTERVTAAHKAGFLSTIAGGYVGHTAVYQGLFPNSQSGTDARPLSAQESRTILSPLLGAETRPLPKPESRTDVGPTSTRADLPTDGADRDVSSNEEDACRWHGFAPCPDDCADHPSTRRRSA